MDWRRHQQRWSAQEPGFAGSQMFIAYTNNISRLRRSLLTTAAKKYVAQDTFCGCDW